MMKTFAGIQEKYAGFENASILFQSIPYDGTSTWGKGADGALDAFLDAAENMEIYDIETNSEVFRKGVYMFPPLTGLTSPEVMFNKSYESAKNMLATGKFVTFFGGEHSISIGVIKAVYKKYPDITILQLDAHADLRKEYMGTPYNHACAVHDASQNTNLIQVGIRSMDSCELEYLNRDKCFFAEDMYGTTDWMQQSIDLMGEKVYITFDLDGLDPSIMPATGTPEPGGLDWNTTIRYLRKVFDQRQVIGFDLVELAPVAGNKAPNFLTAKLYYKMLSYKFYKDEK
ncbi:MAG: agmatinase [Bacteroidetes bacterium CG18_big_fil_WC_8_21_14_2_50_41_14]|nr:MAG: agmatinase [Bacteroidetes bacterium CG18_big_fil_WC_8_21_14_2_50_41_14]PJB59766.1 MAG: agmatinase [Bacteroidetes bacterium CG_4_9_14_3_um_filter_41_19]